MSSTILLNDPNPNTNHKQTKSKSPKHSIPSSSLLLTSSIPPSSVTTTTSPPPSASSLPTLNPTSSNAPVIRKLILINTDASSSSSNQPSSISQSYASSASSSSSTHLSKSDLPLRPLRSSATSPKQSQHCSLNTTTSLPPPPITTHAFVKKDETNDQKNEKEVKKEEEEKEREVSDSDSDSLTLAMSMARFKKPPSLNVQVNHLDSLFHAMLVPPSPPDSTSNLTLNLLTSNDLPLTMDQLQKELQTVIYTLLMTRKAGHHILTTAQILENENLTFQLLLNEKTSSLNQSIQETNVMKTKLMECQSQLKHLKNEVDQTKEEIKKRKQMETDLDALQDQFQATFTGFVHECSKLRDECQKLKVQNEKLKHQLESTQASLASTKKDLTLSQESQAELEKVKVKYEKTLATKEAELLKLKANVTASLKANANQTANHTSSTTTSHSTSVTNTTTKEKTKTSTTTTSSTTSSKFTTTTTPSMNNTKKASNSTAPPSSSSSSSSSTSGNPTELNKSKTQTHSFRPQQQQQEEGTKTGQAKKVTSEIASHVLSKSKPSTTVSTDPLFEKKQAQPSSNLCTTSTSHSSSNLTNSTVSVNDKNGSTKLTSTSLVKASSVSKPGSKFTVPSTNAKPSTNKKIDVQTSSTPVKNDKSVERKMGGKDEDGSSQTKQGIKKEETKMANPTTMTTNTNVKETTARTDHDEDVKKQEKALKKETKGTSNGIAKPSTLSSNPSSSTTSSSPKSSHSSTTIPSSSSTHHPTVIPTTSSTMPPTTTATSTSPSLIPTTQPASSTSPSPLCPKTYNDLARDFLRCLELKDYAGFCSNVAHLVQFEQAQQVNDWNALAIGALWLVAMAGDCHHNSNVLTVIDSLNDVREQHDWVIAIESLHEHAISGSPKEFFHTLDVITDSNMVHQVLPLREILSALRILQRIRFLNAFIVSDNRFKRSNQVSLRVALYKSDLNESSLFKQWIEKELEGTDTTLTITGGGKNISNVRLLKQKLTEKLKTAENTYKRALEFLSTSLPPVGPGALLNQKPKQTT